MSMWSTGTTMSAPCRKRSLTTAAWMFPASGIVRVLSRRSGILRSDAVIVSDQGHSLFQRCMIEEILQGLGPVNDDKSLVHSVFNDETSFDYFTQFDRLILNMLYSPDLKTRHDTQAGQAFDSRAVAPCATGYRPALIPCPVSRALISAVPHPRLSRFLNPALSAQRLSVHLCNFNRSLRPQSLRLFGLAKCATMGRAKAPSGPTSAPGTDNLPFC